MESDQERNARLEHAASCLMLTGTMSVLGAGITYDDRTPGVFHAFFAFSSMACLVGTMGVFTYSAGKSLYIF